MQPEVVLVGFRALWEAIEESSFGFDQEVGKSSPQVLSAVAFHGFSFLVSCAGVGISHSFQHLRRPIPIGLGQSDLDPPVFQFCGLEHFAGLGISDLP